MNTIPLAALAARMFGILVGIPVGEALQIVPRLFIAVLWGAALIPEGNWMVPVSLLRCVSEFLIGLVVAMPLRFLIESGAMFGELLDAARGQTVASLLDPLNGQQTSDLSTVVRVGVTAMAVYLGAFDHLVSIVKGSYEFVPFGLSPNSGLVVMNVLRGGVEIMQASILLGSTWFVGYLLCDLVSAMCSRVLQGLSFSNTAAALKLVLTVLLLINLLRDPSGWRDWVKGTVFAQPFEDQGAEKSGNVGGG